MTAISYEVRHDPGRQRFVAEIGGRSARLQYDRDGDVLRCYHTEVPRELEGRGIAASLVRATLDYAHAHGLRVYPACSYVRSYMRRHPDAHPLLPEGTTL